VAETAQTLFEIALAGVGLGELPRNTCILLALLSETTLKLLDLVTRLDVRHDLVAQSTQGIKLLASQLARDTVEDTKGAKGAMLTRHQRGAGIKTNAGRLANEGIGSKAAVFSGIGHNQQLLLHDGVRAEGDIARRFGKRDTDA